MRRDVRKWLEECEYCELEKARRRQAHGMFSARPSSGPRSRYCMDYQGQGKANTGEVECMGIIDSFSKWVDFFPLHDRAAETLAPVLLNQIHFKHGPPDILHSDEAQTYMSKLLQALYDRLGCQRTTNLGHHAEGNAEIEVLWRFWNRCLRILPPSHYQQWPNFASQIAWAHNTTPQESLGNVSPYEIQYGTLPRSPFDPDPNFKPDSQLPARDLSSPEEYATAVRESASAFKELATRHQEYAREDTARRLNKQGTATTFELGDRVKIYVPPTAKDIERTGRPGKHIVSWRGPCTINEKISATAYGMTEDRTGRQFKRTLINIRKYHATEDAPVQHTDPLGDSQLAPGQLIAIRDRPDDMFRIAKVLAYTEHTIRVHYYGTTTRTLSRATFKPVWTRGTTQIKLQPTQPRGYTAWTGTLDSATLPECIVSSTVTITQSHKLGKRSLTALHHARDDYYVHG